MGGLRQTPAEPGNAAQPIKIKGRFALAYIINPIERGRVNRQLIFDYFVANPCHTNKDAAAALGISHITVGKHARAIRNGWRPDPAPAGKFCADVQRLMDGGLDPIFCDCSICKAGRS